MDFEIEAVDMLLYAANFEKQPQKNVNQKFCVGSMLYRSTR